MVHSRILLAASAILSLARAHAELKRAPFEAVGIEPNQEGFGAPVAENEELAAFAPPSLLGEKNATVPLLKDRSLELVDRQTCGAGFGYCACMFGYVISLPHLSRLCCRIDLQYKLTNSQPLEDAAQPLTYAALGDTALNPPTHVARAIHVKPAGTVAARIVPQRVPIAATMERTARPATSVSFWVVQARSFAAQT